MCKTWGMKILIALLIVLIGFLGYVSTRPSEFHYERSGVINAPADQIFAYISNFKLGEQWNPYDQKDSQMKRVFSGSDGQVGSTLEFEGNREAGAGKLEITKVVPNQSVEMKLTMTKPFHAENLIVYTLIPEASGGTRFSWSMSGDGGFMGKLISVFINCEKMVTDDFVKGIANLKVLMEAKK